MAHTVLTILLIPLAVALALRVIPSQLNGLRAADEQHERLHRLLQIASAIVVVEGVALTLLTSAVQLVGLLLALCVGLLLLGIARCFGHVDKDNIWHRSSWLARRRLSELPQEEP